MTTPVYVRPRAVPAADRFTLTDVATLIAGVLFAVYTIVLVLHPHALADGLDYAKACWGPTGGDPDSAACLKHSNDQLLGLA